MRISDWSSDVCSSDLRCTGDSLAQGRRQGRLLTMRTLADVPAAFPPDRLAIVHGAARWTWGDLDRRSAHWCAWLTPCGVTAADLVAFALPHGPAFIGPPLRICRQRHGYGKRGVCGIDSGGPP